MIMNGELGRTWGDRICEYLPATQGILCTEPVSYIVSLSNITANTEFTVGLFLW